MTNQQPTPAHVIDSLPWKWNTQGAVFIIGGLGFMFDAWDVALGGLLIPLLAAEWNVPLGTAAFAATANLIGMAVGAVLWGGVADRLGRRTAFSITLLIFSLFTAAGAFSPNIETFFVLRFIAGIGLGGAIPVDYALVTEFTPARHRGRVLTAMDGWWPIGATGAAVTSAWILSFGSWRTMMLLMAAPVILLFFVRLFVPESPLHLAASGKHAQADAVLRRLIKRTGAQIDTWQHPEPNPHEAAARRTLRSRISSAFGQLSLLWKHSAKLTASTWAVFVGIILLYYAALTWLPKVLREQGQTDQAAFLVTGAMTGAGLLGVITAALVIDYVGRRLLLTLSGLSSAVLLTLFAIELTSHPGELTAAAKLIIVSFGFTIQTAVPALYTYGSEAYPTHLRASGFGWASSVSRIATGVAPFVYGAWLLPSIGLTGTFATTGALTFIGLVLMLVWGREDRGLVRTD